MMPAGGGGTPSVANASFEAPEVGSSHVYTPSVPGQTFNSHSGVAGNGSLWGFPTAPAGDQAGFIQSYQDLGIGSIAMTVTGLTPGLTYRVRFHISRRPDTVSNTINVAVDGAALGSFTGSGYTFQPMETATFQAGGDTVTITFTGTYYPTGDAGSAIDAVTVGPP
jgi:hypothetical protein